MGAHDTPFGANTPDPSEGHEPGADMDEPEAALDPGTIDWETLPLDHPAWDVLDDDFDMDLDDDVGNGPPGVPPDPSQRTWRHPSEIAAANAHLERANKDDARRMHPASAGSSIRPTPLVQQPNRSNRRLVGMAAGAVVVAALSIQAFSGNETTLTTTMPEPGEAALTVTTALSPLTGAALAEPGVTTDPGQSADSAPVPGTEDSRTYEAVVQNRTKTPPAYAYELISGPDASLTSPRGTALRLEGMDDDLLVTSATAVGGLQAVSLAAYSIGHEEPEIVSARVVAVDPATDIAVLQLDQPAPVTASAPIAAIGNAPVGAEVQIRAGGPHANYSGKVLSVSETELTTSAPVPVGHMGSAVVNVHGRVVGIVVNSDSRLASAVPATTCLEVANNLARYGFASPNWVGMRVTMAEGMVEVVSTVPGGPADTAGVYAGDRLVGAAGALLTGAGQLGEAVATAEPGAPIDMIIQRGEDALSLTIKVGQRPPTEELAIELDT